MGLKEQAAPSEHGVDTPGARYDAFISYGHIDEPIAAALQRGLHTVGRRVGRLRASRVFRDSTDLAANPGLWPKLEDALRQSRHLIVLCSPQAASSVWVNKELEQWRSLRGAHTVLPVRTSATGTRDSQARDILGVIAVE